MSDDQNDSPAFRLRPRRGAPKSYYTVRLEYSANPAAFIRERPRSSGGKRKSGSSHRSLPAAKAGGQQRYHQQSHYGHPNQQHIKPLVVSREERERDEKRSMLSRDIADSITTDTCMSPFVQRLGLDELKSDTTYEHNYITLRIERVTPTTQPPTTATTTTTTTTTATTTHSPTTREPADSREPLAKTDTMIICMCSEAYCDGGEEDGVSPDTRPRLVIRVKLCNHYANESLVRVGKYMSIAKFRTSPEFLNSAPNSLESTETGVCPLPFDVIVSSPSDGRRDSGERRLIDGLKVSPASPNHKTPKLIPFVSITDEMIEQVTEPFVELSSFEAVESSLPLPTSNVKVEAGDVTNMD